MKNLKQIALITGIIGTILTSTPATAQWYTKQVAGLGVSAIDQWGPCVFVTFKNEDQEYTLERPSVGSTTYPAFETVNNYLLYSKDTGPILFLLNGTACNKPRITFVKLGQ